MGIINKIKEKIGLASPAEEEIPKDLRGEPVFQSLFETCKPFTMTSAERMYSLYRSVEYIVNQGIEGDFVECGVWKGGSSMVMAKTLLLNNAPRHIYLYDTFEGMSEPKEDDRDLNGNPAAELLDQSDKSESRSIWCYSSLDEVRNNLASTGFPKEKLHYIQGKVEETIPSKIPGKIALLRLDTDWYESTYHELVHLYPLLSKNGILIIDDYGHWEGARKAVDQYFEEKGIRPLMHRIDYTGRIIQKTED